MAREVMTLIAFHPETWHLVCNHVLSLPYIYIQWKHAKSQTDTHQLHQMHADGVKKNDERAATVAQA